MATPSPAYRAMRKAWPHLSPDVRRRLGRRPAPSAADRVDGVLAEVPVAATVDRLQRDGVVVFDQRLDEATVGALRELASAHPARPPEGPSARVIAPFDLPAPRYDLDEADLLTDPTVQRLVVDASLRRLAEAYLGGEVVNDLAAMWWSIARPGGPSASAAQMFHSDRDRLAFLKFFVYLTDVGPQHGPHVYVAGSHRGLPRGLRGDRRYDDDEVSRAFGEEALRSLTGPAGTIFAADTGGLHKGLAPQQGHRLVFQLEFATNLFGAPYVAVPGSVLAPDVLAAAQARPRTYGRLLAA
ncbi:MAG TPA: phytanoyl-CoA dioxygenase family protein [Acidimicrobiales bacterium]|nr:phytanoyl-CoA dioxygenase family protein [Acidimicrobiales bacterium]